MNFKIVDREEVSLCGLPVVLTNSQKDNYHIISNHWKVFNQEIKKITPNFGSNWRKYGVTYREKGVSFYMPSIPYVSGTNLKKQTISKGKYAQFYHRGPMQNLKTSFYQIYKVVLPNSDLKVNTHRTVLHFEQYDHRFKWNRADSLIQICLQLENNR